MKNSELVRLSALRPTRSFSIAANRTSRTILEQFDRTTFKALILNPFLGPRVSGRSDHRADHQRHSRYPVRSRARSVGRHASQLRDQPRSRADGPHGSARRRPHHAPVIADARDPRGAVFCARVLTVLGHQCDGHRQNTRSRSDRRRARHHGDAGACARIVPTGLQLSAISVWLPVLAAPHGRRLASAW
jgi:hypothetical protein